MQKQWALPTMLLTGAALTALAISCGGSGGGSGGSSTIRGNLLQSTALKLGPSAAETRLSWAESLGLIGTAWAQSTGVTVCLQATDTCATTDEEGGFILPIDGPVAAPACLDFIGDNFSASLCLPFDIPVGSRIEISDITCVPGSDFCTADDIDIDEPEDPSEPSDVSDEDFPSDPSDVSDEDFPSDPSDVSDQDFPSDPSEPSEPEATPTPTK